MAFETLNTNLCVEDAIGPARTAENFIMVRAAKSNVANHLSRDINMAQHLLFGGKNENATLLGFRTLEISNPQITLIIEGAPITTTSSKIVKEFGFCERFAFLWN